MHSTAGAHDCCVPLRKTTTYVRNIFKYYVSHKLTQEARATEAKLRQQVAPAKN